MNENVIAGTEQELRKRDCLYQWGVIRRTESGYRTCRRSILRQTGADNMADFINNVAAMQIVSDRVQTTSNDQLFANKQLDKMQAENDVITQQMDVITAVSTPADQVTAYKKVFGDCCPTPQYTGGCGCGNCKE